MSPRRRVSTSLDSRLKAARRLAIAWGLFLFTLTSWPKPPAVPILSGIPNSDKLVHLVLYGVEAFFLYRAIAWPGKPRFSFLRVLTIVGALAVWGMVDEVHQSWIPGRSTEAEDVVADVTGAGVGAVLASVLMRPRNEVGGELSA